LPASDGGDDAARVVETGRSAGFEIIPVSAALSTAPDRSRFLCLDGIHMTEPYHRLMAKQLLAYFAGALR
jgi:phospholipase/lecithinase/hemolysin